MAFSVFISVKCYKYIALLRFLIYSDQSISGYMHICFSIRLQTYSSFHFDYGLLVIHQVWVCL